MNVVVKHRAGLFILFLFLSLSAKSQQTLTQINGWNAYVHLPAGYATSSINYPTIVFLPGIGEVGTVASRVIAHGPGAYISSGWNGNVTIDTTTVEFIIISLQPSAAWPNEYTLNQRLQTIKSTYRVDDNNFFLTGLSHGGWSASTFVSGDAYGGPYNYADQIAAVVTVQGVTPNDNLPYPDLFDNFANVGGRLICFEQINDGRGGLNVVNRMNNAVPNSAQFIQTNFGGGGHCCWANFYGGGSTQPGNFIIGGISQNIYQFFAREAIANGAGAVANQAPVANAGNDQTIVLPVNSASLSGSGNDADGSVVAYQWSKLSGPAGGNISSPSSASTEVTNLTVGTYQFSLRVTDNQAATGSDIVNLIVLPDTNTSNQLPVVDAGVDQTLTLPVNFTDLMGTATDPDGSISNYFWTKISGPLAGNIVAPNLQTTAVAGLVEGTYIFRLTVKDNTGDSTYDQTSVTVLADPTPPNQAPTANAGDDQTITLPVNSIDLLGSGVDTDGNIVSYQWIKISGPVEGNIVAPNLANTQVVDLIEGSYVFLLTVTDNDGATDTDQLFVTVLPIQVPGNLPPVADAGPDQIITLPINAVTLTGSGTDVDGNIVDYAWSKFSGPSSGNITSANASTTTVTGLTEGLYIFILTVTDNLGDTATDQTIITVVPAPPPPNQAPTANAGNDQTITLPINTVNLSGSGTDPDGNISSYQWTKISGPAGGDISNSNAANTAVSNLTYGVFQFRLTVTDNDGATATDNVQVTVNAPASPNCNMNAPVTHYLTQTSPGEIYRPNGSAWKGGDTVKITGTNYTVIEFQNIKGDPCRPIVIMPQTSLTTPVFRITGGSKYLKIWGGPTPYGIKINPGALAITMSSYIEANNMEISGGSVGIYCKQDPYYENPTTWNTGYVMSNFKFTNLWVHDINGEGMYIGHTQPDGIVRTKPNGTDTTLLPIPLDSVEVSNCLVERTRWDAIQLSHARDGNKIFGNTIRDYGTLNLSSQQAGIIVGGNTSADVYNNDIRRGTGNGIQIFGYGINNVYNNILDSCGYDGSTLGQQSIYANDYRIISAPGNPKQTINAFGNAVNHPKQKGGIFITNYQNNSLPSAVYNNTFCIPNAATNWQNTYLVLNVPGSSNSNNILSCTTTPPANQPPVVEAGTDQTITLPTNSVTLNGTVTDADGNIVSTLWTKTSGPAIGTITNAGAVSTTVTNLTSGLYIFRLTATDDDAATAFDTVKINVLPEPANQAPAVEAGSEQNISLPTNSITLSGTATDVDGNIISTLWTKTSGPTPGAITNTTSLATSVTGLVEGQYVFRLTATDNDGATAYDSVNIYVLPAPANQAPLVNAGSLQTITLPNNIITLTGTATDMDGSIVLTQWSKAFGPTAGVITNMGSLTTTVTGLAEGHYIFLLTATDNDGATASDSVHVYVNDATTPPNQVPTVEAGANQTITLPINTINLNGTATDPDGTIATIQWVKISGPLAGAITNANALSTTATGLAEGTYSFSITVTDDDGASASDTLQVIVEADPTPPNQAPIVNAGTDQVITLPANTVTLTGTASDPDGSIASILWTKISSPVPGTIGNTNALITPVTGLIQGQYSFKLTVTDNDGISSSDTVQVFVNAAPAPPNQVPVVEAGANQTITLPTATINLNGTASDPDGTIASIHWTKTAGPASGNISNANALSTSVTGLSQGNYIFKLTVTDNDGATAYDSLQVTVQATPAPPNQAPTAYAGLDQNLTLPASVVGLVGTGSDNDGQIVHYHWSKVSGPSAGNITNPDSAITNVTGMVAGIYTFRLTVTDNDNATGSDNMLVTVNAAPAPANLAPSVYAGNDHSIYLPESLVEIQGTASDADGQIVSYQWTVLSGPDGSEFTSPQTALTVFRRLVQGVYTLSLTVTDDDGASATDTMLVSVGANRNEGKDMSITVYPNPVSDVANLKIETGRSNTQQVKLLLFSSNGKLIQQHGLVVTSPTQESTIQMSKLAAGSYILTLLFEDGKKISKQIIKL